MAISRPALELKGDDLTKPDPGQAFQMFYAIVRNNGLKSREFGGIDFSAVTPSGESYLCDAFVPQQYNPELPSGKLASGDKRAGWVACPVPKSAKRLTITWDDGFTLDPPANVVQISTK